MIEIGRKGDRESAELKHYIFAILLTSPSGPCFQLQTLQITFVLNFEPDRSRRFEAPVNAVPLCQCTAVDYVQGPEGEVTRIARI